MAPDPAHVRQVHEALLERWRKAMDLVGPGPLGPHLDDAEAVARSLSPTGSWADLGSGAGFPGVALAAWHPAARFTLVESRQKRAAFLKVLLHASGLSNVSVVHGRAEDLPQASFDGVISRAFAAPDVFLALGRHLLVPRGVAVVLLAREPAPLVEGLEQEATGAYEVEGKSRRWVLYRKG